MAARRNLHFLVRRNFFRRGKDDLKLFAVGLLHHSAVKFSCAAGRVDFADGFANWLRPANDEPPTTARPQEKLHDALYIANRFGADFRTDLGFKARDQSTFAL